MTESRFKDRDWFSVSDDEAPVSQPVTSTTGSRFENRDWFGMERQPTSAQDVITHGESYVSEEKEEAARSILEMQEEAYAESGLTPQPVSPWGEQALLEKGELPPEEIEPLPPAWTQFKTALTHDPEIKMQILSDDLDIPIERMGVKDGKVQYVTDDGQIRTIGEAVTAEQAAGKFLMTMTEPAVVGSVIGESVAGPYGAAVGAEVGEVARQAIASLVYGEDITFWESLGNSSTEALLGLIGGLGAKGELNAANKLMSLKQKKVTPAADLMKKEFFDIDTDETRRVIKLGKDLLDIDVLPAQATKSRNLAGQMKLLRNLDPTAPIIEAADTLQNEKINANLPKLIDNLFGKPSAPYKTGADVKLAAEKAIKGLEKERSRAAKPFYDVAFSENPDVDIEPIMGFIDGKLNTEGGSVLKQYESLKKLFLKPDLPKKVETGKIKLQFEDPTISLFVKETAPSYETKLVKLDGVKQAIDAEIETMTKQGVSGKITYPWKVASGMLDAQLKSSGVKNAYGETAYQVANDVFSFLSTGVKAATDSPLGKIARTKPDQLSNISTLMLSSKKISPELITNASGTGLRDRILSVEGGKEIWDSGVRDYITGIIENIPEETFKANTNIAKAIRNGLVGKPSQRANLKAAMDEGQFETMSNLMDVLESLSITASKESPSISASAAMKDLEKMYESEVAKVMAAPLRTPELAVTNKVNSWRVGKGAEKVAEIITNPASNEQLLALKRLDPESDRSKIALGVLALMNVTALEYGKGAAIEGALSPDIPITVSRYGQED